MDLNPSTSGPEWFVSSILDPGLGWMTTFAGPRLANNAVQHFMLAIAMQESGLLTRTQGGGGPAHGWWQFEEAGGVAGVLHHPATHKLAIKACISAVVAPDSPSCWRAIEGHDGLAVTFARLLLLSDPAPIPTQVDAGWATYLRLWRPGRPREESWANNWFMAGAASKGAMA